jgi:hypothetical protein
MLMMPELDMRFCADFKAGQPRSFRDVAEMSERAMRSDAAAAQVFPALTAGLHAICCILWRKPIDEVRAALVSAFPPAAEMDVLPLLSRSFGSGPATLDRADKDRPRESFRFDDRCLAALWQLGLSQKPDYFLGLTLRLPVALEPIVWSAVRASPIRDFFCCNQDLCDQMWLARPGRSGPAGQSGGAGHWMSRIEGRQLRPSSLGPAETSFLATFSEDFQSILIAARNG